MYDKAWLISQFLSRDFTNYKIWEYTAPREVVIEWYRSAVREKKIQPIETQTEEIKQSYWDEAKKSSLPLEEKIKIAKCIYYLSYVYESTSSL
jgi:hypothetical protein